MKSVGYAAELWAFKQLKGRLKNTDKIKSEIQIFNFFIVIFFINETKK